MIDRTTYEIELQELIKVWVFNFSCGNCIQKAEFEDPSDFRYISPFMKESEEEGTYANPPTLWCGCNEMLYAIQSHGLYDLLDSLFDRGTIDKKLIIIRANDVLPKEKEEEEEDENFGYEIMKN